MIGYAPGDGLTEWLTIPGSVWGCSHRALVDIGPVRNGLGPDQRDWRTLPAYRARIERAKRDIERGQRDSRIAELAAAITDDQFDLWCSILQRGTS